VACLLPSRAGRALNAWIPNRYGPRAAFFGIGTPRLVKQSDLHHRYDGRMAVSDVSALGLAPVFSPAQATEILRSLGLEDLTECALRTRAYRRQVPFHQNGRRITFTVDDIREIAEGQAHRPEPRTLRDRSAVSAEPARRRRGTPAGVRDISQTPWRARRSLSA
jgi:hypothetical protein